MLYFRYVGMVERGKTPWDRFSEDLAQRKFGVFGEFLEAVANDYPQTFSASTIDEIVTTAYPIDLHHDDEAKLFFDDRERIIISTLNRRMLLNEQAGGFFPCVPSSQYGRPRLFEIAAEIF
jgi:hypothetical protein